MRGDGQLLPFADVFVRCGNHCWYFVSHSLGALLHIRFAYGLQHLLHAGLSFYDGFVASVVGWRGIGVL